MTLNFARFGMAPFSLECVNESFLTQAIDNLASVDSELLVANFPVLVNQLFHVLTSRSLPAATSAFALLPHILQWYELLSTILFFESDFYFSFQVWTCQHPPVARSNVTRIWCPM